MEALEVLEQKRGQLIGTVQHDIVTAVELVCSPAARLRLLVEGAERRLGSRPGGRIHIGDTLDAREAAAELYGLLETGDRLQRALAIDPGTVGGIHSEDFGGNRWALPSINRLAAGHRSEIQEALAILRYESIQVHQRANAFRNAVRDARDDHAAIGVAAQHDILELLPPDQIEHIQRVGVQIHRGGKQVRALPDTRERRSEHFVTLLLQGSAHALPAPAAVPCAMNQYECSHVTRSREGR